MCVNPSRVFEEQYSLTLDLCETLNRMQVNLKLLMDREDACPFHGLLWVMLLADVIEGVSRIDKEMYSYAQTHDVTVNEKLAARLESITQKAQEASEFFAR